MDQSRRGFFKAIAAVSAGAAVAAILPAAVPVALAPVASDAEDAYQFVVSQLRYTEAEFITRHYEPVVYERFL